MIHLLAIPAIFIPLLIILLAIRDMKGPPE